MTMATVSSRAVPGWVRPWVASTRPRTSRLDIVDDPPLAKGERRLLTYRAADASSVVATVRAVYHQGPAAEGWARLGWEQVGLVHWDEHVGGLLLTGWTPQAPARTVLAVPPDHALLALACERVAWTVLISVRVPLTGHGHAHLTARRQPGTDRLLWRIALSHGGPDDPAVRAELDAALARLRTELGRW
jgi:hypothetical protein